VPLEFHWSLDVGAWSFARTTARQAFTLIELLSVIAIIGILAAILIPTVGKVRESARKAKVKTQLSQWAVAIETFRSEFGYYPDFKNLSGGRVNGGTFSSTLSAAHYFHDVLGGRRRDGSSPASPASTDPLGQGNNRKRIVFATIGPDELSAGGKIIDAFGNEDIAVILDTNYDGVIPAADITSIAVQAGSPTSGSSFSPPSAKVPAAGVRAGVVLFTAGPGNSANDIVYSWQ
jgi:prepilin-type N-terminal cleavage/methylation domain-containing protein